MAARVQLGWYRMSRLPLEITFLPHTQTLPRAMFTMLTIEPYRMGPLPRISPRPHDIDRGSDNIVIPPSSRLLLILTLNPFNLPALNLLRTLRSGPQHVTSQL